MESHFRRSVVTAFNRIVKDFSPPFMPLRMKSLPVQMHVVRGETPYGINQFIALIFHSGKNQCFMEIASSVDDHYPSDLACASEIPSVDDHEYRFRVDLLWGNYPCWDGWIIKPEGDDSSKPENAYFGIAEGLFESPSQAVDHMRRRLNGWILPYLKTRSAKYHE